MKKQSQLKFKNWVWPSVFYCFALYLAGFTAAILTTFYLMGEMEDPSFLVYLVPVPGFLFYGIYYIITQKLDPFLESRAGGGSSD